MAAERTPDEILTIRERLREIEFHAKSSDDFLQGLVADPEDVLRRYGIDEAAAAQIVPQLTGAADFGAGPCGDWCDGITCISTGCCFFTGDPPIPVPPE
jgi:hypothetical protein